MGLIMPLPGDYNDTANTGLVISQYLPFIRGRLLNITVGKIDIVDTVSGFFPSVAFGQEGFSNVNGLVTALPWFGAVRGLSLYGGVVSTVNQEYQAAESGILVTGTTGVSTSWGSIYDAFDEGVFIAAMHRFFWKLDDKPGNVMLFAGGSTREQASNDRRDFTIIPGQGIESTDDKKPWDVAIYVHQIFWQAEGEPDRKATVFFGGTLGPDNPQFAQYHVFAAVEAFGLMTSRPHDRMGLSGWKNWLSDDFVDLVSPVADLRDTYGFELYYNMEITKWLHVTADLQIIENENDGDDLAIIPGIRVVIDF